MDNTPGNPIYLTHLGVSQTTGAPGESEAGWQFLSSGVVKSYRLGFAAVIEHDWHLDAPSFTNTFQIYCSTTYADSGNQTSSAINTWLALTTSRSWYAYSVGGIQDADYTFTISIRDGTGPTLVTQKYHARARIIA